MANKVMKITAADFEKVVRNAVNQRMKIAGAGGSPGQPYTPPKEDPKNPYVPAPTRKLAAANNIRETGGPLANDDSYGEGNVPGHPDWKLSGGPQLPNFKPMGRVIKGTRRGVLSPEENKIKQQLQIGPQANVNYGAPTERDLFLQRFQGKDGTLRNHPEKIRSTILGIGGRMKADASNNIRSLQESGHQTVLDDNRPGHLKIIKQFKPPKA
jgi:hypothetical protein